MHRLLLVSLLVVLVGISIGADDVPRDGASIIAVPASEREAGEPVRDRDSSRELSEAGTSEESFDVRTDRSDRPDPALIHESRFLAVPAPSRGMSFGPRTPGSGHGPDRARPAEEPQAGTDLRESRLGIAFEVDVPPLPTQVLSADRYARPPPAHPHFG